MKKIPSSLVLLGAVALALGVAAPGIVVPPVPGGDVEPAKCTPHQTEEGGLAVINFSECIGVEQAPLLRVDYDQNNFGELDTFEAWLGWQSFQLAACYQHFWK